MISARKRPLACLALGAALLAGRGPNAVLAAPAAVSPVPTTAARRPIRGGRTVDLRLVAINDFHGALSANRTIEGRGIGGADHLAAHVARLRWVRPGRTLVVHAGDAVSASPAVSALFQDEPAIAVLNEIGVDVGVVGNHEFDEGPAELRRLLAGVAHPATAPRFGPVPGVRFPTLAANVVDAATGAPVLPPTHVASVGGVPVGFVGVVTTETPRSVGPGVAGLAVL
ncbi:MAG: hypothetical protein M3Q10_05350, partial [Chloroflexota bacterium]|nr:hypothetical protein [Chloroflexota bacterium]